MAGPILVPCLVALRAEFNAAAPGRDKRSDGWVGDRGHALAVSDHNPDESGRTPFSDADNVDEVHGLDVDRTGPWPGGETWFDASIEYIRARHMTGADDRLQNIIWRGRIASRSWGWGWRPYTGQNQHHEHVHFSARYTTAQENDTTRWLPEDDVTPDDHRKIRDMVRAELRALLTEDADPGDRAYSLGGMVTATERRSDQLANRDMPDVIKRLTRIEEKLFGPPPA